MLIRYIFIKFASTPLESFKENTFYGWMNGCRILASQKQLCHARDKNNSLGGERDCFVDHISINCTSIVPSTQPMVSHASEVLDMRPQIMSLSVVKLMESNCFGKKSTGLKPHVNISFLQQRVLIIIVFMESKMHCVYYAAVPWSCRLLSQNMFTLL